MKKVISFIAVLYFICSTSSIFAGEFHDGVTIDAADVTDSGLDVFTDTPVAEDITWADSRDFIENVEVQDPASTDSSGTYTVHVPGTMILSETQRFCELVNEEREKKGVPLMKIDHRMMELAVIRAPQLTAVFQHILPDDAQIHTIQGLMGEAIAATSQKGSAEKIFSQFMNSAAHRDGLLDKQNTRLGFAVFKADENHFFTAAAMVGSEAAAYPYVPYSGHYMDDHGEIALHISPRYLRTCEDGNLDMDVHETVSIYPRLRGWSAKASYLGQFCISNGDGIWESSDPAVVTIDGSGNVKALDVGTAVLKFYVNGDHARVYQKTVHVKGPSVTPTPAISPSVPEIVPTVTPSLPDSVLTPTPAVPEQPSVPETTPAVTPDPIQVPETTDPASVVRPASFHVDISLKVKLSDTSGEYVELTWNQVPQADGYVIYMAEDGGGYKQIRRISDGSTSYKRRVGYDKKVVFMIQAYKTASKNLYSNCSNEETIHTAQKIPAPEPPVLEAVRSGRTIKFCWNKPEYASVYQLYASVDGGQFKLNRTIKENADSTAKNFSWGKTYRFRIRAGSIQDGKTNWGDFSTVITVKLAPVKPAIKKIANSKTGKLMLTWTKSSDAKGYEICRKSGKNGKYNKLISIANQGVLNHMDAGLVKGKIYYYRIRSYVTGEDGKKVYSSWSSEKGIKCK